MVNNRIVFDLDELDEELNAEVRRILLEIANEFVNQLKREAPVGATGDLQRSFQIFRQSSGEIVLGSRLGYAQAVQEGRGPHTPDFEQIRLWARRKLGDEDAAGAVFRSIQQNGTPPNDYLGRAMDNTLERFQ